MSCTEMKKGCDYCQQCEAKAIEISSDEEMEVDLETPKKV